MKYSRLQKIISYLLLFLFFLNISVNIPSIISLVLAKESSFYNLVSIIVDEKTYSEIKTELNRYSRDISSSLENTKVVILPVPEDASVYQIASMNEAMFFDGYKSLSPVDFESRLMASVFVGKIPIPTVYKGEDFSRTVLPYIDFDEKSYVYNRKTKRYEENKFAGVEIKPEIEFSFISPNTGDFKSDIDSLKTFFNKNHDYYTGNGIYKQTNLVINGKKEDELNHSSYEPYVFYYDYFREKSSLNISLYSGYRSSQENIEDLTYGRYTPALVEKMKKRSFSATNGELLDLAKKVDPNLNISAIGALDQSSLAFDVHSGVMANNMNRNYINSFAKGTVGELRKDVFNAGRYNFGKDVNVDFPSHILSNIDIVTNQYMKDISTDIEKYIDNEMHDGVSRKIAVPMEYNISESTFYFEYYEVEHEDGTVTQHRVRKPESNTRRNYGNFLYGREGSSISKGEECSYYRGSLENGGQLVEANRGRNIMLSDGDIKRLGGLDSECLIKINETGLGARGLWGRYSPLYIQQDPLSHNLITVGPGANYRLAIEPLFDIRGSQVYTTINDTLNPFQCFDNNYLLKLRIYQNHVSGATEKYEMKGEGWSCVTANPRIGIDENLVEQGIKRNNNCDIYVYLDGQLVDKRIIPRTGEETYICTETFTYKSSDSVIEHKQPDGKTLASQNSNLVTENLPIDKNRYLDFIRADGQYVKINYPNLYRLNPAGNSFADAEKVLIEELERKSKQINIVIARNSQTATDGAPSDAFPYVNAHRYSGTILNIIGDNSLKAQLLRKAEYPNKNIDLVAYLKGKGTVKANLFGETKEISYYDLAVLSIMWGKFNNPSEKYKFLFEKYLSDETKSTDKYALPKTRKQYEIAYLGANGNAQNMMISLDPNAKDVNPYADIITNNQALSSKLLGYNILNSTDGESSGGDDDGGGAGALSASDGLFKCGPPDGVPLWEWPSAIQCRLKDMLPPKITISDGYCSAKSILDIGSDESSEDDDSDDSENDSGSSAGGSGNNGNQNPAPKKPVYNIGKKDEKKSCDLDENKNGISDCLEKVDSLKLSSDSTAYSYNDYVNLTASFYDKDRLATYVNNTSVSFELLKIEKAKDETKEIGNNNLEIVYDVNNKNLNNPDLASKFVNFSPVTSRSSIGEAKYGFSTKNQDVNIYLRAKSVTKGINSQDKKELLSNILKVEVRSDSFTASSAVYYKKQGTIKEFLDTIEASDKPNVYIVDLGINTFEDVNEKIEKISLSNENLIIGLSRIEKNRNISEIKYPLNLKLIKKGKVLQELDIKDKQESIKLSAINDSGSYDLRIQDGNGLSVTKKIVISSSDTSKVKITLGSNLLLTSGSVSTNILTLYDKFDNPVSGNRYVANLELSGNDFVFIESGKQDSKSISFDIYEGFKAFRIKSLDNPGEATLSVKVINPETNEVVATTSETIKSIENINVSIDNVTATVGGGKYKFNVSLIDVNGNIIPGINSRLYFSGDSNFFSTTKDYFKVKDGKAEVEISTKTLSGVDIPVEVQVEGIGKIFNSKITINPLKPIKVDVLVGESKLEAKEGNFSPVSLELRDKYNNLAFTDSETKANVEIHGNYSKILKYNGGEIQFKNGIANFKINATEIPGIGYFKVSTTPDLKNNSFLVKDSSSESENGELTVEGVGENVGKIETFYFWNKEKVERQHYNALYTTLLGSNYGDLEQKDYLAGALIFDKNSRALAVTSLLETGAKKDNVISVNDFGNIKEMYTKADLSQNIIMSPGIDEGKLYFSVYNKSLNKNIGKIYYNLKEVKLSVCDKDFLNCLDENNSSVAGISFDEDYRFFNSGNKLTLVDKFGNDIFFVDTNGNFTKKDDLKFEIDTENSEKYLSLKLKRKNQFIGNLAINVFDNEVNISRDRSLFKNKISASKNSILVIIESNSYGTYRSGKDLVIFYDDPFGSKSSLNKFTNSLSSGYENFPNKSGIGWKDENKTLLSFAAGKSVGQSVKDHTSFYTINIGDPFVKLKKQKKKFNGTNNFKQFDSTIGKIISNYEDLQDYKIFDYNNDGKKDIVLLRRDNYLELLENKNIEGNFLSHGNVVQIYDLGPLFETGDFTGDGYGDIFFIGNDGKPYILNNVSKDFTRIDLSNKIDVPSKISQTAVFDMDNDKKTDLVILDESGEISIFYGGGTSANPTFTKKILAKGLGLALGNDIRKDGGAMYYSGLYQPESNPHPSVSKGGEKNVDKGVIDSEIYVQLPYTNSEKESNLDNLKNSPKSREQKFFLKSEYLSSVGISYEKTFKDRNGGSLVSGDVVDVEIKIKNTSGRSLVNLAYLDKFEKYFNIDGKTIKNSKQAQIKTGIGSYNFLIDGINLGDGETLTITYSGTSRKITHTTIRAGLFEKGESGDDLYGDVIVDDLNLNCGIPLLIYKSVGAREYEKSQTKEECGSSTYSSANNKIIQDGNKDGVPDYFDQIESDIDKARRHSQSGFNSFKSDKDGDGVFDDSDYYTSNDLASGLSNFSKKLEQGLDSAEDLLNGLSCGFNNGSCFSSPLNWAPLAPGSDPTFMGSPIGDGLMVEEGLPVFSAITWVPCKGGICPTVWPSSPLGPDLNLGAGGRLGTNSPTNFFRIFVTPTLTGGVGTAICLGAPPSVIGNQSMPMGLAPLFPGGNCIVVAKPLISCSNDGSEGDPSSVGIPDNASSFGVINGGSGGTGQVSSKNGSGSSKTCSPNTGGTMMNQSYVSDYIKSSGGKTNRSVLDVGKFKNAVEDHSKYNGAPLFKFGSGEGTGISVKLSNSNSGSDFSDIEKIQEERIKSFPEFLMDWVTRQIEEIVSKLTDFPTIFLILPDFTGIYDSNKSWEQNWQDYRQNSKKKSSFSNPTLTTKKIPGTHEKITQINSGIREAYEFISTLPLINLNQETVNITVPWISQVELDRAFLSRERTIEKWKEEVAKYTKMPGYSQNIPSEVDRLITKINKNKKIIQTYMDIPQHIKSLINKKEDYLEQIICNVEIISDIMGGRIGKNGERFKAWVELYILIKAILKSWQSFIDIFVNYEEECKECKNERHDLLNWEFQLISMIIPEIPVIEFPKWPDIVIDLHNIRASLDVAIPEFVVTTKPINLPHLPELHLPNIPGLTVTLPDIPILPEIKLPELPDLPSLPKVELPDLPPPPKLPKLFEGFEFIIDVAKLVVKAMCILKMSPFHPEWRAGDQIAFLTERNGFLGIDFLSKSFPKFSLPFVDSINVVTYVNLEFETEFLVELAEQLVKPVNSFTSDFTNVFKISIDDLDLSNTVPSNVDVEVGITSYKKGLENSLKTKSLIASSLVKNISEGLDYADKHKTETVSNSEFKKHIAEFLGNPKVAGNPEFDDLREAWKEVENYTFASEDELIKSLKKFNFEKYESLINIINSEKSKNKNLNKQINDFISGNVKVSLQDSSSIDKYNEKLSEYNQKSFENISKIVNYNEENSPKQEIKELGDNLLNRTQDVFGKYADDYRVYGTPLENYQKAKNFLASNNGLSIQNNSSGTCSPKGNSLNGDYSYNYSGIYVIENGRSYRLFDYIDEVKGDEGTTVIDFDGDSDDDLLYFVNNTLYLKENLDKKADSKKIYLNEAPLVLNPSDNKILKGNFIEAVNNGYEADIANSIINLNFSALRDIYNYRLTYFNIIDKYLNPERDEINLTKNKNIIDGIAGAGNINLIEENDLFAKRKDLVYINRIGNFRGLEITTNKLTSIKEDLLKGNSVLISNGTTIHSGPNYFEFKYKIDGYDDILTLRLEPYTNLEAKEDLMIIGINRGDGFVDTKEEITYKGDEVSKMKGHPMLFETKITFVGDKADIKDDSYIELYYYDNSELRLDFRDTYSWELYDLGYVSTEYLFSISRKNDYYYSRVNPFKNNLVGTSTDQILLSPQLKADKNTPEIALNGIKVPVYQEVEIDITDKVTEDSGLAGISKLFIDFFLETDTDGDLNTRNDDNSLPNLSVYKKEGAIYLKVGKFTSLIKKKIGINVIDENGNFGSKEIDFEIYSPIPEIESYDGVTISGRISEQLKDEPINFYKFRGGSLSKLGDEKGTLTVMTNDKGEYSLKTGLFKGGLSIKDSSGKDIASISEKTGKIELNSSSKLKYNIKALRQKDTNYPEIFIQDNSGKNIFNQILRVIGNLKVGLVTHFENIEKNGVYVKTYNQNEFGYYVLPENIRNNPGVFVGYKLSDENKNPVFQVYPDGRLEIPDSYKIIYDDYKNYIVLKILDNSGKQLFDVFYKIDADYVIN